MTTPTLLAHYKFENNVDDSSGNNYDLTNVGSPTYSSSDNKVDTYSIEYSTTSYSYATQSALGLYNYVTGDYNTAKGFSISFWFKIKNASSTTGDIYFFSQGDKPRTNKTLHLIWKNDNKIGFNFFGNDKYTATITRDTSWKYYVFTCNALGHRRIYIDGVSVLDDNTNSTLNANPSNPNKFYINRQSWEDKNKQNVLFDDYKIYSGVLHTMTITSTTAGVSSGSTTNNSSIELTFTSDESTEDFVSNEISVTNGVISNFSVSSGSNNKIYTATFTPSSGGETTIKVLEDKFTDANGNNNYASNIFTWIYDNSNPTAYITYNPSGPYKQGDSVTIKATFNESMKDSPITKIEITGSGISNTAATEMDKTSATEYTYEYTVPSGNGTGTVSLSVGTDLAGNVITETPTSGASFTVDNTAPTAAITYDSVGPYKNGETVIITATFSEAMSDSPKPKIAISGISNIGATEMDKTSTTVYTYEYTVPSGNGTGTVSLSVGTDLAGNVITTITSGASFTVDNSSSTFSLVNTLGGNKLQANKTYNITFTVSSSVTMKFGGSNNTDSSTANGSGGEYFNGGSEGTYNTGANPHTVSVTPTQNWNYLWATVSSGNDTDITSMTCRQSSVSYEAAFDSNDSRFIMEMVLIPDE